MGILKVLIDGAEKRGPEACISVADEGLLRGDGVFEVLRVYGREVFALDEHVERMRRSAAGLRLTLDAAAVAADARALAAGSPEPEAVLRLVMTRGGRRISLLETVPAMPESVRLATVSYSPSGLLDGLKTLSYAGNSLATRLAQEQGGDQALLVRPDGTVLEGPNFSLFLGFGDDEPLVTPPLRDGILDSITRRRVLALVPVSERSVEATALREAREAFVVSTLREVLPVSAIDGVPLAQPGARTQAARLAFRRCVAAETRGLPVQAGGTH